MKPVDPPEAEEPSEYATPDEVEGALNALEPDEIKDLYYRAKKLSLDSKSAIHDEDLLHEAVYKTLNGQKRWRRGIPLTYHLIAAMRNIVGHSSRRSRIVEFRSPMPDCDENEDHPKAIEEIAVTSLTPRDTASASDDMATIREVFNDDAEAWDVLQLRSAGHQKEDIIQIMKISPEKYGAIKKRIQRTKCKNTALLFSHENPASLPPGAPTSTN